MATSLSPHPGEYEFMGSEKPRDEYLIRKLPLPLARLYCGAFNAKTAKDRHNHAYYLWEASLKLLASVAIVEYGDLGRGDAGAAKALQRLARPALGDWRNFARLLVPLLATAGDDAFAGIREEFLISAPYGLPMASELDEKLSETLGKSGKSPGRGFVNQLFDRLVTYRNKKMGHGAAGQGPDKSYEPMGWSLLLGVSEILARFDVLAGRRLRYVDEVHRLESGNWQIQWWELTGENARRLPAIELPRGPETQLPIPNSVYLFKNEGGMVKNEDEKEERKLPTALVPPLFSQFRLVNPLMIYEPDQGEMFFLNSEPGQQNAEYLCYSNNTILEAPDVAGARQEFLERILKVPVEPQPVPKPPDTDSKNKGKEKKPAEEKPGPAASGVQKTPAPEKPDSPSRRIMLSYKRRAQPDEDLLAYLEKEFTDRGHQVFVDRHIAIGMKWAEELQHQVREADAVILLLSAEASKSEMVAGEAQMAHEEAQKRGGKPQLLPIRINFQDKLPSELAALLDRLQYFLWTSPGDNPRLLTELLNAFQTPTPIRKIPPPTGVVPLDSKLYLVRPTDAEFQAALERQDSLVLIKGARQMGKTSLLARGLKQARQGGSRVVMTDFQMLNASDLETVDKFYRTLGEWIADELDLEVSDPEKAWSSRRGPSVNFQRFIEREILAKLSGPLLWAMDEVDRLFVCPYGSEVFGLFRAWHNARGARADSPLASLTMVIAYATEAHLFITDLNQSPFNVGTKLTLEDFSRDQVAELNQRYPAPLRSEAEVNRFFDVVGGNPYLVNRGLYEMAARSFDVAAFEAQAAREEGVFGDHLRRILVLLAKDPELREVVRGIVAGKPCQSDDGFLRLRSAGIMAGDSRHEGRLRCRLYETYLERHLR